MATDQLLDMLVPSRASTWRWQLIDTAGRLQGDLPVDSSQIPTMSVDISRPQKRTIEGVRMPPGVIDDIDPIQQRVLVSMVLQDGREVPQGIYIFSDPTRAIVTSHGSAIAATHPDLVGDVGMVNLTDQTLIVDQGADRTVVYRSGQSITGAITDQLSGLPVTVNLLSSFQVLAEDIGWEAGTSRLQIINELARMLAYTELYFDNVGLGQLQPMPNPELTPDDQVIAYPSGRRTYLASASLSNNLLRLPNRFIVVGSGTQPTPVVGVYDIPASAPHSQAKWGFPITHKETMQGIETAAEAQAAAQALAREGRFAAETVEYSGPPDPRHDHYNTVSSFEGVRYLELSWRLPMSEGSEHRHVARRTYETFPVETLAVT